MTFYNEYEVVIKNRLKNFNQLGLTLHDIDAEIKEVRETLATMRNITPIAKYEGMPHGSDGQLFEVERTVSNIMEKETKLKELKAKREDLSGQIELIKKAVNTLIETDKELLEKRYFYNMSIKKLGKNEKWTNRRINKIVRQLTLYIFGIDSETTRKSPFIFLKSAKK